MLKSQKTADESLDLSYLSLVEAVLPEEEVFTTTTGSSTKVGVSLPVVLAFGEIHQKSIKSHQEQKGMLQ